MLKRLAAAAVVAAVSCLAIPASACNKPGLQGCIAPELNLLGGCNGASATTKLKEFRGKPVLIEFWAPTCVPCRKMLPKVEQLHRKYRKQGLEVLAISLGSAQQSKDLVDRGKLTMPVAYDTLQKTMARYKVKAIPATFLVDKDGVVRPTGKNMEAAVKREIKRAKRAKRRRR